MEFKKKYDVDTMLEELSPDCEVSETDDGDKTQENGEKNFLKKPLTVEEQRALKRKTKKNLGRQSSKEGTLGVAGTPNFIAPQRRWKNSRRSRNGQGRGATKKAGGGRGNWGKLGTEFDEEFEALDHADPNFNDDEDLENVEFKEIVCASNLNHDETFLKNFEMVMLEYFEHGDTHEVASEIDDNLRVGTLRPLVIRKAIEMAFEHKNSHREMTSVLLSDLYSRCLISSDYEKGFDMLLDNLPDLMLDTPDAPHLLGNFLARAVADDCLMPKYINQLLQKVELPAKNGNTESPPSSRVLSEFATEALSYADRKSYFFFCKKNSSKSRVTFRSFNDAQRLDSLGQCLGSFWWLTSC